MKLFALGGREWQASCEALATAVEDGVVRFLDDELVRVSLSTAVTRETASGWLWDLQRCGGDPAVLVAVTAALRALMLLPEPEVAAEPAPFFVY